LVKQFCLFLTPHNGNDIRACELQHLRNQHPQLARAQHHNTVTRRDMHCLSGLQGSSQRLDKYGLIVAYIVRHKMKIAPGKRQIIRKCTGVADDTDSCPVATLAGDALLAEIADLTGHIDFPDNPFSQEFVRTFHDIRDKLVPKDAREAV
jgi:hypothetical protein